MAGRSEQETIRLAKLEQLRKANYPFPNDFKVTASSKEVLAAPVGEAATAPHFSIAGRIVQFRLMGKAAFVHILDSAGKIQTYIRRDDVGEDAYAAFKECDIGDIVGVTGYPFVTKTGEKSLHAATIKLLVKSLIPLPEKWHGLTDVEARYRYRYVDLISNPEVRTTFKKRALILKEVRNFFDAREYVEVETPTLQYQAGGTNAKPFSTFYNSLDTSMVLRIALELNLKKCVVGGIERVYEIGRNFRNEGFSKKHNPEFTMIEFYQAYATFEDLMTLTEELLPYICEKVNGSKRTLFGETELNFEGPYPRIPMKESIYQLGGVPTSYDLDTLSGAVAAAAQCKVHLKDKNDWGKVIESLWAELVEPKLIQPTFITHHPFSISPLARQNQQDPRVTDRFEIFVCGMELGNAFSELNDPIDQRQRFEAQALRKAEGDEEAMEVDEDYIRALEYGMPPTAGQGIGIDRLVMLMTNSPTIRDVLLFPQLKPESAEAAGGDSAETTPPDVARTLKKGS